MQINLFGKCLFFAFLRFLNETKNYLISLLQSIKNISHRVHSNQLDFSGSLKTRNCLWNVFFHSKYPWNLVFWMVYHIVQDTAAEKLVFVLDEWLALSRQVLEVIHDLNIIISVSPVLLQSACNQMASVKWQLFEQQIIFIRFCVITCGDEAFCNYLTQSGCTLQCYCW